MKLSSFMLHLGLVMLVAMDAVAETGAPRAIELGSPIKLDAFQPPSEDSLGQGEFADMVRLGKKIFIDTPHHAGQYTGNDLSCSNCHLNAGRLANSAPLWAAWVSYPAYRGKNKMVNTMEQRIQGCFRYSMNGTPPPADSRELKAIMSYAYWLASGAPTNVNLPGRGYPKLDKPAKPANFQRGQQVYQSHCALCHGDDGQGQRLGDKVIFPPLWGERSFNWGAGMHRINTAASFIRANMPLGQGGSLSVQQAWDVAYFLNSHERPQDPRFNGDLAVTDEKFHNHQCRYGDSVEGKRLGQP
jgi:thiosulfate dehydrogenase